MLLTGAPSKGCEHRDALPLYKKREREIKLLINGVHSPQYSAQNPKKEGKKKVEGRMAKQRKE